MAVTLNASTSSGFIATSDTSGVLQLQANGVTKATVSSSGFSYPGAVLQVVSTTKTDSFSTSASSMTDVTGLSVSITPTSSSSKILILLTLNLAGQNAAAGASYQIVRGSTAIALGDSAGSRPRASGSLAYIPDSNSSTALSGSFLDSPATTSSTTYKIQVAGGIAPTGSSNAYVNRTQNDTDSNYFYSARTASTITVMEIAA